MELYIGLYFLFILFHIFFAVTHPEWAEIYAYIRQIKYIDVGFQGERKGFPIDKHPPQKYFDGSVLGDTHESLMGESYRTYYKSIQKYDSVPGCYDNKPI